MPINGVRVLPDMPKNFPCLDTLIREFETIHWTSSYRRDTYSEPLTLNGGNFVKKIVQAYEMSVKVSTENAQRERAGKRSGLFSNLEIVRNRKNVEEGDSSCAMHDGLGSDPQTLNNFKKSKISPDRSIVGTFEDNFALPNRHCSKCDEETTLKTGSGFSSKINMYGSGSELSSVRPSVSKKTDQILCISSKNKDEDKSKNKLMTYSNLLEADEDKDKDEDPLDNILTNSRISSCTSNSSYRNLQIDLYNFDDEGWQLELSSHSLPAHKSYSSLARDDMLSSSCSLLDSYFQDFTMTPSKSTTSCSENSEDAASESTPSDFKRESPRTIGVSLKRPIKIVSEMCVTWIPTLGERLPRKRSLKKFVSAINSKLSRRKLYRKLKRKQLNEQQCIADSGFIEQLPSSSSSSQKSSYSDTDEKSSASPTFGTFGHAKGASGHRASRKTVIENPRVVLTEVSREKLADDPKLADPISWASFSSTPPFRKRNVDSSSSSATLASSSRLAASCEDPSLPKHPHLSRSRIPKHPFVARTKMDQIEEEEATVEEEKEVRQYANVEVNSDARELESIDASPISAPMPALDISYPKMCEWVASSPKCTYHLPRARLHKPTSAIDNVRQEAPYYDVPKEITNLTADSVYIHLHEGSDASTPRYATVNSKNLRFSMSREKLRAIERSFDG